MIPWQIKAGVIAAALIGSFFFGAEWTDRGWEAKQAEWLKQAEEDRKKLAKNSEKLQKEAADGREKDRVVYVDRIKTIYKTVPATYCLDDDTKLLINEAAARASREASGIDEQLPADRTN